MHAPPALPDHTNLLHFSTSWAHGRFWRRRVTSRGAHPELHQVLRVVRDAASTVGVFALAISGSPLCGEPPTHCSAKIMMRVSRSVARRKSENQLQPTHMRCQIGDRNAGTQGRN